MIVAVPPGGPADTLSRLVSPRLTEALGRTVIIDNRPGANGNIAYEMTARATPDGHTFTAVAAGVVINPSLYPNVAYDPLKDFAPITLGITLPNILVVHPSVAATSVKELIALAKAKPGAMAFASAGSGTSGHLALELFRMTAGIDVIHVPYKGGGPALAEVVAGQVQALFSIALSRRRRSRRASRAARHHEREALARRAGAADGRGKRPSGIRSGRLVRLARSRSDAKPIVSRLHAELVPALKLPTCATAPEPDHGTRRNTPQEFAAFMRSEHAKWASVIKAANVRVE